MEIEIREALPEDISFLRLMLYETVYWRAEKNKPDFDEGLVRSGVKDALGGFVKKIDTGDSLIKVKSL